MLRKRFFPLLIATAIVLNASAPVTQGARLEAFLHAFVLDYKALNLLEFGPDHLANLKSIPDSLSIIRRKATFNKYRSRLKAFDPRFLSLEAKYLLEQVRYEIETNLERLELELDYRTSHPDPVLPDPILSKLPNHARWYRLYLRKAASQNISPEEALRIGEEEVKRITKEFRRIQKQVGFEGQDADFHRHLRSDAFLIEHERAVLSTFEELKDRAQTRLGAIVEDVRIPPMKIAPIPNPSKDAPPGYYNEGVFYFNFFGGHFNKRAVDWLFLHEALPGHHYQLSISGLASTAPELKALFFYSGFAEGWGAYCENLGKDLGFYADPYQELGRWEWDLVRSARVVIDVGIHHRGWTKAQALTYWRDHIQNQDDIAAREIDRIIRWPGQAVSYKVGEAQFLRLKKMAESCMGKHFDLKKFHSLVLNHGSLPLDVLNSVVVDALHAVTVHGALRLQNRIN